MRTIAVYPGRFHPFHRGHAASFKQLAQKFGLDNTYLAISAKQEQPKSPFSAQDRAKMAMSLGIPSKNIIAVRNPYAAQEYIDQLNLDPEKTAIIFGVSKKDMEGEPALGIPPDPRFSFKAKKDGSPSYLQPFSRNIVPMNQHGYVMSTDVAEFPIAGKTMRDASAIRSAYAGADQNTKMRILKDLYGDAAEKMKQVFDNNLQVTESIRRLIAEIKPLLSEATITQKAKFVKLLSEAKKVMISETQDRVYSSYQIEIIEDLGNGYVLVDDSYDDDEGFVKEGYSVFYQVGPDQFRLVGHVNVSPYRQNRRPGDIEREVDRLINQDQNISEEKSGIEQAYHDPDTHSIMAYAREHYPEEPDLQAAFVKFVLRSLKHSKEDDQRQDNEIELLLKRVNSLQSAVDSIKDKPAQKSEKVDESADYLREK